MTTFEQEMEETLICANCWINKSLATYKVTVSMGSTYVTLCEECAKEWVDCGATLEIVKENPNDSV